MTGHRRSAPHVARNAGPIAEVLRDVLPERGLVLELASGTGEHIVHFAREFPNLLWLPSDPDPAALRSIEAWRADAGLLNLLPPVALDARAAEWPVMVDVVMRNSQIGGWEGAVSERIAQFGQDCLDFGDSDRISGLIWPGSAKTHTGSQ